MKPQPEQVSQQTQPAKRPRQPPSKRHTLRNALILVGILAVIGAVVGAVVGTRDGGASTPSASAAATSGSERTATTKRVTTTTKATTTTLDANLYRTFSGSGSDVVDMAPHPDVALLLRITGNAGSRYFGVDGFDKAGEQTYFGLVNTTDPYDGVVLIDWRPGEETNRLQVEAKGEWTIEVMPLTEGREVDTPGTIQGSGDDVVWVYGSPSTLKITGNPESRYFGVDMLTSDSWDFLVNTTDPYEGRVIVPGDGVLLVEAVGAWSITTEP